MPRNQRQLIAVAAGVDQRTVTRVLDGLAVKPVNQRRVQDALTRLAAGELRLPPEGR